MNTPPPRRRKRKTSSSPEPEYQSPRRRKKKPGSSSKKKKKQPVNTAALLKIALFSTGALVLVAGVFMVDWQAIGDGIGLPDNYEKMLTREVEMKEETADMFASITDAASAEAAGDRMAESSVEAVHLEDQISRFKRTKEYSDQEDREIKEKLKVRDQAAEAKIRTEMQRLQSTPALGSALAKSVGQAQTAASKARMELMQARMKK
ncbi:hypothetical protein [Gimesia maris]|uniref:hypothetical protein n=1 Tax=Gimesia maris TaxID=122 RepID=UPI003A91DA36